MCQECDLSMPSRDEILKWLEAYPMPSEEQAGIAGKLGRLMKQELLAAWNKEESFDLQQIIFDLQRFGCIWQGFQQALQPLQQQMHMQMQMKMRMQQQAMNNGDVVIGNAAMPAKTKLAIGGMAAAGGGHLR